MDYIKYLGQKLNTIRVDLNISNNIEVYEEQAFLKHKSSPNTIYLVVRFLSADISLTGIKEQPVNIVVMSEQNSLENAKAICQKFAETYNWKEETIDDTYLKQSYGTPFVLNNFEDAWSGFRSVMYMSATLQIMESVADVENLKIDGVNVKPLSFQISYNMTGNTQQIPPKFLSSTVKSTATLGFSLSLPLRKDYIKESEEEMIVHYNDANVSISSQADLYDVHISLDTSHMKNVRCDIQNELLQVEPNYIILILTAQQYAIFQSDGATFTYIDIFNLLEKAVKISLGKESGNDDFKISFLLLGVAYEDNVKCILSQIDTAPNSIPRITLGFML